MSYNERVKLLAVLFNNLATAFAVAGLVAPLAGGQPALALWVIIAAALHATAQLTLGRLRP